ncbi:hypothetical protein BDD12DRAFT_908407 [Trichophaea hybrida]|nr:hypothetical protein BDD12DRAFT_908407 [Trichophaea hybrida]
MVSGPLRSVYLFLHLGYSTPISPELEKRSTNGNGGLTTAETAGLVVGIIGLFLTALTVFKGWECWKSGKDQTNSTTIGGSSPSSATTVSHHVYHYFPSSPGIQPLLRQGIALESIPHGQHSSMPPDALQHSVSSPPHLLHPLPPLPSPSTMPLPVDRRPGQNNTARASTWPTNVDATTQAAATG